jgi:predicted DNA-binding transcriptional regulator AlpA
MKTERIIIYPKDVQRITGKSARYRYTLLNKIKESKQKAKNQFVSVNEFAEFTGLSVEEITSYLQD